VADPIGYLGRGGDDWIISAAIVQRARQLQAERRAEELTQHAKAVGGYVAEQLSQMFR
jgi:hypothetical protein